MRGSFWILCAISMIATGAFILLALFAMSFYLVEWLIFSDLIALQISQPLRDNAFQFAWVDRYTVYIAILAINAAWFYQTTAKSIARRGQTFASTPTWATLYFFIPLVNLYAPFLMTRRKWNLSVNPELQPDAPAPSFFWVWWLSWLMSLMMYQWLPEYAQQQDWNTAYATIAGYAAIGAGAELIAAVCFIHIQRTVSAALLQN